MPGGAGTRVQALARPVSRMGVRRAPVAQSGKGRAVRAAPRRPIPAPGQRRTRTASLVVVICLLAVRPVAAQHLVLRSCGVFSPAAPAAASVVDGGPTTLTGDNRLTFYAGPDAPIEFSLDVGNRWERRGYVSVFAVTDEAGMILHAGQVADGNTKVFSLPVPKEGAYHLQVSPDVSICALRAISKAAAYEASKTFPMVVYPKDGWWFFYVPTGTGSFCIHLDSPVPDTTRVTVRDAAGQVVVEGGSLTDSALGVRVPPAMDGNVWSFRASGPTGWQSMSFWLDGACPYVADTAAGLLLPLVNYSTAPAGEQTEVTIRFNLTGKDLPPVTQVTVRVEDETSAVRYQNVFTGLPDKVVSVVPDSREPAAHRLSIRFTAGTEPVLYRDTIWTAHRALFRESRHEKRAVGPPDVSDAERARGFLTFARAEPGSIYQDSVPAPEERVSKIGLSAAPGRYAAFHFAVHALQAQSEVTYRVTPLRHSSPAPGGTNGPPHLDSFDLRVARYWPQREASYSNRFYVVPELLERAHPIGIAAGRNGLFYGRLRIPDEAEPGLYRGTIEVSAGGTRQAELELTVDVLPFRLRMPDRVYWILDICVDVSRDPSGRGVVLSKEHPWDQEPSAEILARYRLFRDIGVNALSLPLDVQFENTGGTLRPTPGAFTAFSRRIDIVKQLGFKEPLVLRTFWDYLSREAAPQPLSADRRTYTEPAREIYRQHLSWVAKEAAESRWPDYVFYEVDEPDPPENREHFFRTAKVIKEMGGKVFSTVGDYYIDEIDQWIDYRCINAIDYACVNTAERARKIREHSAASGDVFWLYGGGSYTYLEGIICGNRYLNGLFLWRTGATGLMNWIACWPMYNLAIDDFDDAVQKDYCIYYPSLAPEDPLTPTLQWEGIREGIDDYRYLYTFLEMAREVMASGDEHAAAQAQQLRTGIEARLAGLPWRHSFGAAYPPQDITNGDLQQVRHEIVRAALALNALRKGG
jgi:hypothetical protein